MGVNSVSNSNNGGAYSASSFAPDPNINKFADQQFAKGTGGSAWFKDYYKNAGLSQDQAKTAFEGYEQWLNHEAMKVMDQCASDMGSN